MQRQLKVYKTVFSADKGHEGKRQTNLAISLSCSLPSLFASNICNWIKTFKSIQQAWFRLRTVEWPQQATNSMQLFCRLTRQEPPDEMHSLKCLSLVSRYSLGFCSFSSGSLCRLHWFTSGSVSAVIKTRNFWSFCRPMRPRQTQSLTPSVSTNWDKISALLNLHLGFAENWRVLTGRAFNSFGLLWIFKITGTLACTTCAI